MKPRNRLKNIASWVLAKVQGQFNGERIVFLSNGPGSNGCQYIKNVNLDIYVTFYAI